MNCKNCGCKEFYELKDDYIKCKNCSKKYSLKKLKLDELIINHFIENKNALETSQEIDVNYRTVKNRFDFYRLNITTYLEQKYNDSFQEYNQYEEHTLILNKSKNLSINILGFSNGNMVYTILMPNYLDESNKKKIHSNKFYETKLYEFWSFLDENFKKYKGINSDRIILYIKEYEFKFNYEKQIQKEILSSFI